VGGSSISDQGPLHPFLYHQGQMQDLGTLGGDISYANAINSSGEIVGYSNTTSNLMRHPFLYRHGRMHDLGTLGGTNHSNYAAAINNAGQVVGEASAADGTYHAFLCRGGAMFDLNNWVHLTTTNGPAGFLVLLAANGINDHGQIVGNGAYWDGAEITSRAYLLDVTSRGICRRR